MKKITYQISSLAFSITLILLISSINLLSQKTSGKSAKTASRSLDFNGDGREDLINVQQISGKMSADGLSLNGKNFLLLNLANSQNEMMQRLPKSEELTPIQKILLQVSIPLIRSDEYL